MTAIDSARPLIAHLVELRKRFMICGAVYLVAFGLCYLAAPALFSFLTEPLHRVLGDERRLIYTALTEAFVTYLRVAAWAAFFVCFPLFAHQLWRFVAPGLYANERGAFRPFLVASPVLFLLGAALAYYFVFPMAWGFFASFETVPAAGHLPIMLEARVGEYLNLVMALLLAFGLAFQLPVALLLLVRAGLLTVAQLKKQRRLAIVVVFAVAAVLTPPDVLSQILLAVPMMILYESAIWCGRLMEKKEQNDA